MNHELLMRQCTGYFSITYNVDHAVVLPPCCSEGHTEQQGVLRRFHIRSLYSSLYHTLLWLFLVLHRYHTSLCIVLLFALICMYIHLTVLRMLYRLGSTTMTRCLSQLIRSHSPTKSLFSPSCCFWISIVTRKRHFLRIIFTCYFYQLSLIIEMIIYKKTLN